MGSGNYLPGSGCFIEKMSPFFRKITSCSTYLPLWPFTGTNQLFSADLFLQQWWNFHSKIPFQTSVFWGAGILARKSPPRLNCEKRDDFMVFSCCKLGVRPVWLSGFIWVRNRPLERNNGFGRIEHCSLTCTFNDEVQLMLWWNIVSVKKCRWGVQHISVQPTIGVKMWGTTWKSYPS